MKNKVLELADIYKEIVEVVGIKIGIDIMKNKIFFESLILMYKI